MALEAARHLCQEARVVLTSLRGGPPMVARGDLAQDLVDLRGLVKHTLNNIDNNSVSSPSWQASTSESAASGSSNTNNFEPDTSLDPPPPQDVGIFARPFLNVVMDPRAAGPHTLVALRALHRLLEQGSLFAVSKNDSSPSSSDSHPFVMALEPLTKGVLNCKFEQTDAGADEAVEMAIADLLALIVQLDRRALQPETLMDAFNTVFVTRNTFVHSPALCYHFEDVLTAICEALFGDLDNLRDPAGKLVLEFLVNQLLHTPLMGGLDEASREAQMAHDATRILCLRLARTALQAAFGDHLWSHESLVEAAAGTTPGSNEESNDNADNGSNILQIIQDDLCLSLLMTGQAVWSVQGNSNYIAPGVISLEVLTEICSTLTSLWTITSLRKHLISQFEAIFTGFYQRALVLLRKRMNATDSLTFHSNMFFDAGVEVILESLVDIMTMHDHRQTVAEGNGGSLETLFALYDCNIKRSDVAVDLMVDLCRCTGSKVDEEGNVFDRSVHGDMPSLDGPLSPTGSADPHTSSMPDDDFVPSNDAVTADGYRQVPPHLRELCAEAINGAMKCLFKDDHPSDETKAERHNRQSILAGHVSPAPQSWSDLNRVTSSHHMRNIKSKKRLMRQAAQLFNKKSSKGIEFMVHSGIIQEPVTPRAVASFLRNGIVVGLDKPAVGAYLGEVGKSPEAGKSPPVWQRDWFHKEVLEAYCSLFRFERQSLLDGLRMFLAAFRLPGEAQQIDRILQAFSDSCSRVCEEGVQGSINVFSEDPKRASDAAYLLSFSIIMLNTDQHNDNIREDRKMSKADFVKNNTDYGRDITEKGKELPREYLEAIYNSIRDEEIRTEGEGADGSMTVERWKDVLRGSSEETSQSEDLPSVHDAEDLTELVLEHLWMPIMSSISALWGTSKKPSENSTGESGTTGMFGAQGARLGMDMAWDMLVGVRQLGRNDIFCKIFNCVCKYSGLLDYKADPAARSWNFAHSVEPQSAFVVALRVAKEATDEIGVDGWKRIWLMLFELRDLKMLGGGISTKGKSLLLESEPDLLRDHRRREWTMKLIKRGNCVDDEKKSSGVTSVFGAFGRALFGSGDDQDANESTRRMSAERLKSLHGKEEHVIWDEIAPSDDEDESASNFDDTENSLPARGSSRLTLGAKFESLLIQEDLLMNQQREMPVTGLERVDDSNAVRLSPRARVRKRLSKSCDYASIVSESRFMDDKSIGSLLQALIALIPTNSLSEMNGSLSSSSLDKENSVGDFSARLSQFPVSPASEALAEIMLTELALRNRDRLSSMWHGNLKAHYESRIKAILLTYTEDENSQFKLITGAMEKCLTGLLRISGCAIKRGDVSNDILRTWTMLREVENSEGKSALMNTFDRHLGEGLWRITRGIDGATELSSDGWDGIMALCAWCANRGFALPPVPAGNIGKTVGLSDDDPSLQVYRSIHFLLNVSEVNDSVPSTMVKPIRTLVSTGEVRHCPKLGIAALDLLHSLSNMVEASAMEVYREPNYVEIPSYWDKNWVPILDSMAEACHSCSDGVSFFLRPSMNGLVFIFVLGAYFFSLNNLFQSVRQHALSMLADTFLEKQGSLIPVPQLCHALSEICIPISGRRISDLRAAGVDGENQADIIVELEACISLLFKPLRHHVQIIIKEGMPALLSIWGPILTVVKESLQSDSGESNEVIKASNELILEHLRNVVMVLINLDILEAESQDTGGITSVTWNTLSQIEGCKHFVEEWKQAAENR